MTPQITQIHLKDKKFKQIPRKKLDYFTILNGVELKGGKEGRKKQLKRVCIKNYFRVTVLSRDLST